MSHQPQIERQRHLEAFEEYRDLGFGRTYREVARRVGASPDSVARWAKNFKWEERVQDHEGGIAQLKEEGTMVRVDTPVGRKMLRVLLQMESLIDSAFTEGKGGKFTPTVKVKDLDQLTKFVEAYRKFMETYGKLVGENGPSASRKDQGTSIKEFNMYMGGMSQEERIAMMKGLTGGNDPGGDRPVAGGSEEADFTEVPERGDAD